MKSFDQSPEKRLDQHLECAASDEREELKEIWRLTSQADERPSIPDGELDRLWGTLARQTTSASMHDRSPVQRLGSASRIRWTRFMLLGCLVAGMVWSMWSLRLVTTEVGPGRRAEVLLPDGSRVFLNSGTSIRYPRWFLGGRSVALEGEAFFDVVHDAASPFKVSTFNTSIEVLGTRFNVRARASSPNAATVVSLQTGRIRMWALADPSEREEMTPGDIRSLATGSEVIVAPASSDVEGALSWLKGALLFRNEGLAEVLEEVGRRYGIELTLQSEALARRQVTFSLFEPKSVEQVVQSLSAANGLRYRETAGGYELYEAPE